MSKYWFCGLLTLWGLVTGGLEAASRPNVLFLLSDDQRFDTIHALGNPVIQTPNLDRLVARGRAFDHAFIMGGGQGAICAPSRAMMMTGHTLFHATTTYTGTTIPLNLPLLPKIFRQAGYETAAIGKWHNDREAFHRAFSTGGPIFFGGMANHNQVPVYDFDPTGAYPKAAEHVTNGFSSELFADAAVKFLRERPANQPFFLYVAFTAPHDPRTPPENYATLYSPEKIKLPGNFLPEHPFDNGELKVRDEALLPWPRQPDAVCREIATYYGMITHLDAQIGRILEALERAGQATNTIIVFAGDNGLALGQHGLLGKQNLYEASVRVPLIFAGPGVPHGKPSPALCYLLDIFPTLCDLSGVAAPAGLEGQSLAPVLRGESRVARPQIFAAYRDVQRMIRDDRWKLIEYPAIHRWQLFDLRSDPLEMTDLGADPGHALRLAGMQRLLAAQQRELGDSLAPR